MPSALHDCWLTCLNSPIFAPSLIRASFYLSVANCFSAYHLPHPVPDLYSGSYPNYCFSFFRNVRLLPPSTSIICFIPSYLSPLPFSPYFLPTRVETHIHVVRVVLLRELHVPSCERALPEDGASSTETVSSCNFSKALLSPSEKKKNPSSAPVRSSIQFLPPSPLLAFWKHSLLLSYFLLLLLCYFIIFHAAASSTSQGNFVW